MPNPHLPNADGAVVSEKKVVAYLLSEAHPDSRSKARFFLGLGFSVSAWQILVVALQRHAIESPVIETIQSDFGVRYVVEGEFHAPDGRTPIVRTVWFVDREGDAPRLVTAYPVKRR